MERKGNRLPIFTKRFRELQGERSNTDFADFLGLSRQTVGFYCNGDRLPDVITLIQIAERCNVSTDYLLGASDVTSPNVDIQKACEITGLSEDAIYILQDSTYASDALNEFLLEKTFCNLLMNMLYFSYASVASGLYYQIFNSGDYDENEKDDLLKSIYDSNDVLEDIKRALKIHIKIKKSSDGLLSSSEGGLSPEDFYELRVNKNVLVFLHDIASDKWWLSAEAIIDKIQGNFA